jgi:hypothetical protein
MKRDTRYGEKWRDLVTRRSKGQVKGLLALLFDGIIEIICVGSG